MVSNQSAFEAAAKTFIQHDTGKKLQTKNRHFRDLFGVTKEVCDIAWTLIGTFRPTGSKPVHVLQSLLFLKIYASEHANHTIKGADEKTFRKWSWCFSRLLADLKIVSLTRLFVRFIKLINSDNSKLLCFEYKDKIREKAAICSPPWLQDICRWDGLQNQ